MSDCVCALRVHSVLEALACLEFRHVRCRDHHLLARPRLHALACFAMRYLEIAKACDLHLSAIALLEDIFDGRKDGVDGSASIIFGQPGLLSDSSHQLFLIHVQDSPFVQFARRNRSCPDQDPLAHPDRATAASEHLRRALARHSGLQSHLGVKVSAPLGASLGGVNAKSLLCAAFRRFFFHVVTDAGDGWRLCALGPMTERLPEHG